MWWLIPVAISAFQSIQAGRSASKAGKLDQEAANSAARVYDWNARVADLQAEDAIDRGRYEEDRFRSQIDQFIGTQRATQAASGTDVNFGSNVDVQADTAYLGELDALAIRTNAYREAWGYRVEGIDNRARAMIARKSGVQAAEAGKVAARAAYWQGAGTIIGAGTSLLAARYGFPRTGGNNRMDRGRQNTVLGG